MKILVSGGAGFIGSHLSGRLLGQGHEVWCIDSFNDYYSPLLKEANVEPFFANPLFRLIRGDILDKTLVGEVFDQGAFDAVFHLAARAGVRPSLADPALYIDVNVHGTTNMLEAARRNKVGKFIFASSSSVYGVNPPPFAEADPILSAVSPYAATKIAGEAMCHVYSDLYAMSVMCLRFFTVYGPRQRPEMAISKFVRNIAAGAAIDLYGDGRSSRDYTYVEDIVDGMCACLGLDRRFEILNIGNSHPVELQELIRMIEKITGRKAVINRVGDQAGDVPVTFADIGKAGDLLGYSPKVSLEEGLRRFYDSVSGAQAASSA